MKSEQPCDPQTPQEWNTALRAATIMRVIADCTAYGLLKGGPKVNVEHCDKIIEAAAQRGYTTANPTADEVAEFIEFWNAQSAEKE